MDRKTKEELNALSKEVFGTSSRWRKIVDYGVAETLERDREIIVPRNGRMEKKIVVDNKSVIRRYSVDEVKKLMEDLLVDRKKDLDKILSQAVKTKDASEAVKSSV